MIAINNHFFIFDMLNFFNSEPDIIYNNDVIILKNIKEAYLITEEINKYYSGKHTLSIFIKIEKSTLTMYKFYVLDLIHMLENIIYAVTKRKTRKVFSSLKWMDRLLNFLKTKTIFSKYFTDKKIQHSLKSIDSNFIPKIYQEEFIQTYLDNKEKFSLNGYLLAGTAGSGKTATSLMLYQVLNKTKCIIICPKVAIEEVWVKHVKDKYFRTKKTFSTSLEGDKINLNNEFIIIHYEFLSKIATNLLKIDFSNTLIVVDESHNFNEIKSQRTNDLIDFSINSKCKDIILMSGTPIKATPSESIPLFRCIIPDFTLQVLESFKKIYKVSINKSTEILEARLGLLSFKVQKNELGLPEPIFHNLNIKISNGNYYTLPAIRVRMEEYALKRFKEIELEKDKNKKLYDLVLDSYSKTINFYDKEKKSIFNQYLEYLYGLVNKEIDYTDPDNKHIIPYVNNFELKILYPFYSNINKITANEWRAIRSGYKYPELKVTGECLGVIIGGARIDCHAEMVKAIPFKSICDSSIKKTVVFTSFTKVVEECNKYLPLIGLNNLSVYAKTTNDLKSITNSFRNEIDVNPLVATFKSLSTAVPLDMADTMIIIDLPFRDYILQQSVSRIHRLDSDTQTNVYLIQLDTGDIPNISNRTKEILQWSQKQIKQIIGIESPFEITDDNIMQSIISIEGYEENSKSFLDW